MDNEVEKCVYETASVQSIAVGILWEASEGAWEDARRSIEHRLKPEIEKLEACAGLEKGELLYEHTYVDRAIKEVGKEDLDGLMSATQTFVRLLPVDISYFLRGLWPYRPELRTRTKWELEGGAVEEPVTTLKIGSEVTLEGKKGVIIDASGEKFRVRWDDKTENWIIRKDSEIFIVY